MARIVLDRLSKDFSGVMAVNSLSLDMADGSFVTLVGPSGCGKSTTLNCLAGLEDPSGGEIIFDDLVVNRLSPRDRNVAMVFQDYALYSHKSVYDNVSFALQMRSVPKEVIDQRVREVAQVLGLSNLLDRKPAQLSGGQQQRVALARAIARDPVAFLLDEPLSNLDAALRVNTRTEIKRLQRVLGTTTVFVTHDQEEAMVLSDVIAVMNEGELQQYDTPQEVYNRPANHFVAQFIGSPRMNFFRGELRQENGSVRFESKDFKFELPAEVHSNIQSTHGSNGNDVIMGVRPHDIEISVVNPAWSPDAEDTLDSNNHVLGNVELTEPIGPTTYVDLSSGESEYRAGIAPDIEPEPGDTVAVTFDARHLHFFDSKTGDSLVR